MSMKKTDLEKHLSKKIDGKLKSGLASQRFGQGSAAAATAKSELKAKPTVAKPVPVAIKLPAELLARLRERAVKVEGGINAVIAEAAELWLKA
jgi:hypothetical protein